MDDPEFLLNRGTDPQRLDRFPVQFTRRTHPSVLLASTGIDVSAGPKFEHAGTRVPVARGDWGVRTRS